MRDITVLITGAGAPGAPGIIKSLRKVTERNITLIGVDHNIKNSVGQGMVDKSFSVPSADNLTFIQTVFDICMREKVDVVIPLVTKELLPFALVRELFDKNGIKVLVSDYDALVTANNKHKLMEYCKGIGVPVPEYRLVSNKVSFVKAVFDLGYPNKKVCFKPPVSNGMRGFRVIEDGDRMDALINEKPDSTKISLEEFMDISDKSKTFPELLVMEYCGGAEYSVDVLVDNGRFLSAIPRTRDQIKMGISFVGTTVYDKEIIGYCRQVVEGIKLHGNIGLQFRRDKDGVPKVIECNPRVQGTIVLCTAAGQNMVYDAVRVALGETVEAPKITWGVKMIRYWDEIYIDAHGNKINF